MAPVFRSKKEVVYDQLREDILHGKYKPGSRLVIDELAETMGVSQIPIREAMRQLEADGFVTIEPYVGATVTPIDANFIVEVFALLEAMEIIGSRAACQTMTDTQLQQLADMINKM
ncbi:MAG TPA: GntR family transcriptional regulator, partial [Phototrophicaceae bacterium]|nr:GntR family transcriptional regulator [Phototrophicaceae bacterium]